MQLLALVLTALYFRLTAARCSGEGLAKFYLPQVVRVRVLALVVLGVSEPSRPPR
jgi:hypothetical protein